MVVLLWTTYVLGPYIMAESFVSELVKLCRSLHQFTTLKREYLILYEVASSIIVRKYSTFEVNHSDMLNIYLLLENEYNISGRVTPPFTPSLFSVIFRTGSFFHDLGPQT